MAIPNGTRVRQIVPAIEGETVERRFSEASGGMEYLVPYTGPDGEAHERWFAESEITVIDTKEAPL